MTLSQLIFKKLNRIGVIFIVGGLLMVAQAIFVQHTASKIGINFDHTQNFEQLKLDVVQIQQFLTDASATGEMDSIKEAKTYYQDAIKRLQILKQSTEGE